MHTNNNGSSYWRLKIMKIVKSYAWYCMRHVKTSEAYQLDKKRKFFPFLINQSIFTATWNATRIIFKETSNHGKELPQHFETDCNISSKSEYHDNIYNSIFSTLVLIPTSKLFTTYCNRKQIHCLFYFLVSAL